MNKRPHLVAFLCAIALSLFAVVVPYAHSQSQSPAGQNWPLIGGNTGNIRYSSLTQINPQTINGLAGAWVSDKFDDGAPSRSMPVIVDGMMFVTAGSGVYAIDARTGKFVWKYKTADKISDAEKSRGINWSSSGHMVPNAQGVAVAEGKVFLGLTDGHVTALDEKDGHMLWINQAGDERKSKEEGRMVPTAPSYANGEVFVGTGGDYGATAKIVAFDSSTGKKLWEFFVVPRPGEPGSETWPHDKDNDVWKHGGGGVWQTGAVDPDLGLVYFGTGNTVPQYGGEIRPGNNLYTDCVLALDMKTGKLRWYYQLVHHDIWEADIAIPVVLYDTQIDGKPVKGIAAMRPDGYLFLLDRVTGKPLVPVQERPVTQSAFQKTAPTQPFPDVPEGLLPPCDSWKDSVPEGWKLDCEFYPWDFGANVLAPGFTVRVTPMSYDPQTGYFYAQGSDAIRPRRLITDDPWFFALGGSDLSLLGLPPGKSFIAAIDGRTDKVAWKKEVPATELARSYAGPFSTGSGLLFRSTGDGFLEAYDAKSGDLVWKFQTGTQVGPIATYELDGEQYIAMVAGPEVWAFKIGGTIKPVEAARRSSPRAANPDAGAVDGDQVETASIVRDNGNSGQRYAVDEDAYDPIRIRVKVGTPVYFVNNGRMPHTIVARDGSWTTGTLYSADSSAITFDKPGKYLYYTKERPWAMGEVIVTSGADQELGGGLYTPQQADRGKTAYMTSCSACHGSDMSGSPQFPALKGDTFLSEWQGHPLVDLIDRTRTTMPQGNPGSLSSDTYMDIVSYILQMNGMPSGNAELKADSPSTKQPIGR